MHGDRELRIVIEARACAVLVGRSEARVVRVRVTAAVRREGLARVDCGRAGQDGWSVHNSGASKRMVLRVAMTLMT